MGRCDVCSTVAAMLGATPLCRDRCLRPALPALARAGAQDVMASMLAGMGGMAGLQQMMGGMGGGMPAFNPEGAADEPEDDDGALAAAPWHCPPLCSVRPWCGLPPVPLLGSRRADELCPQRCCCLHGTGMYVQHNFVCSARVCGAASQPYTCSSPVPTRPPADVPELVENFEQAAQ